MRTHEARPPAVSKHAHRPAPASNGQRQQGASFREKKVKMNQASVTKLLPKLKFPINAKPRKLKNELGPEGRLRKIRQTLTALIKYERLELNYARADETRGYAELLISQAIRNGEADPETEKLVKFWVLEKTMIEKLFTRLVPRFKEYPEAFTNLQRVPVGYEDFREKPYQRAVLELKLNPYPSLSEAGVRKDLLLHNMLLAAANKSNNERNSRPNY